MEDNKLEQAVQTEQVEEVIEPTPQEKLYTLKSQSTQIEEYIQAIDELVDKQEGDEFVLGNIYCKVIKRTPKDGRLSIDVYELDNSEEQPKAGKWLRRDAKTQDDLAKAMIYGKYQLDRVNKEILKLENEILESEGETK